MARIQTAPPAPFARGTRIRIKPSRWGHIVAEPVLARVCKPQGSTLLVELDCGRIMFVARARCEVLA